MINPQDIIGIVRELQGIVEHNRGLHPIGTHGMRVSEDLIERVVQVLIEQEEKLKLAAWASKIVDGLLPCSYCLEHNLTKKNGCNCWVAKEALDRIRSSSKP